MPSGGMRYLLHAWPRLKTVPAPVSNKSLRVGLARDGGSLRVEHADDICAATGYIPDLHQTDSSTEPTKSQDNTTNKIMPLL